MLLLISVQFSSTLVKVESLLTLLNNTQTPLSTTNLVEFINQCLMKLDANSTIYPCYPLSPKHQGLHELLPPHQVAKALEFQSSSLSMIFATDFLRWSKLTSIIRGVSQDLLQHTRSKAHLQQWHLNRQQSSHPWLLGKTITLTSWSFAKSNAFMQYTL